MAYEKNKHLANIKKFKLDLSKLKDGVYHDHIYVLYGIKEFRGFKETFGFEIKELKGGLSFFECTSLTSVSNLPKKIGSSLRFYECTSLTSVSNLPEKIGRSLSFDYCTSLTSLSNLPEHVGGYLNFNGCNSLTYIEKMPKYVEEYIYVEDCPFFENLTEAQIREKYGILKE